jgi:hypothetical protein
MTLAGRNLQSLQHCLETWDRMTHEDQAHDSGVRTAVQRHRATYEAQAMSQANRAKASAS